MLAAASRVSDTLALTQVAAAALISAVYFFAVLAVYEWRADRSGSSSGGSLGMAGIHALVLAIVGVLSLLICDLVLARS